MDGFLTVDKPPGMTSHDVVARVRRVLGTKHVGHGGTLDPGATGVLVVAVGKATRLFPHIPLEPKVYEFTLMLGVSTTTHDSEGTTLAERDASAVTPETLEAALERFRGDIRQIPPMYSAVHHEGRRLYELARQGVEVEREPRTVIVDTLKLVSFQPGARPSASLECVCSGGTYMRTLCNDIGETLDVGGHMGALRRLACGGFRLDAAVPVDRVSADTPLTSMRDALSHLPSYTPNPIALERVRHGGAIPPAHPPDGVLVCLLNEQGELIALARWVPPMLQPILVVA
jgi:tRNA pseudouridine55 synthase